MNLKDLTMPKVACDATCEWYFGFFKNSFWFWLIKWTATHTIKASSSQSLYSIITCETFFRESYRRSVWGGVGRLKPPLL